MRSSNSTKIPQLVNDRAKNFNLGLTQGLCDDRENILWNSRMPNLYKAKLFLMKLMWLL